MIVSWDYLNLSVAN